MGRKHDEDCKKRDDDKHDDCKKRCDDKKDDDCKKDCDKKHDCKKRRHDDDCDSKYKEYYKEKEYYKYYEEDCDDDDDWKKKRKDDDWKHRDKKDRDEHKKKDRDHDKKGYHHKSHHIHELDKTIRTLLDALAELGRGAHLLELKRIIHKPGWTTPAELAFTNAILDHLSVDIRAIERLQADLVEAARKVEREHDKDDD